MDDERKRVVARGYDALVGEYIEWSAHVEDETREALLADFITLLPQRAAVLDLGCGAGLSSTRLLAQHFRVTGVDISAAQVEAARRNVPGATFINADLTALELPEASFDGVAALFSIIHVPREEHAVLFRRVAHWLRPGGLLVTSLGARDSPDWIGDWLGQPMFFSGFDADTNRRLLRRAGFELLRDNVVEVAEPDGSVPFLWVLARRPGDRRPSAGARAQPVSSAAKSRNVAT